MHTILFEFEMAYSLGYGSITVLNNIMLLIIRSRSSVPQASPF